jgi:hypothetical protein
VYDWRREVETRQFIAMMQMQTKALPRVKIRYLNGMQYICYKNRARICKGMRLIGEKAWHPITLILGEYLIC